MTASDARQQPEHYAEEIVHARLSDFLRACRSRIPMESCSLGRFQRGRAHVGKPVTQGEVAEACGISRQWYVLMENNRSVRVSGKALSRIAEALMMTPGERVSLFRLAVPELRSVSLTQHTRHAVDAITQFRPVMRKLLAANTAAEVLTIARDFALVEFGSHVVTTSTKLADGCWESAWSGIEHERFAKVNDALQEYSDAVTSDYAHADGVATLPGVVVTRFELDIRFPEAAGTLQSVLDAANCSDLSVAMVELQSRRGLNVRMMLVDYQTRKFTACERTQLRTLAGIVSLALPG